MFAQIYNKEGDRQKKSPEKTPRDKKHTPMTTKYYFKSARAFLIRANASTSFSSEVA